MNYMQVVKDGNIKKCTRPKPCKKYYITHDNGGRPFLVRIFEDTIDIYENAYDEKNTIWNYYKTINGYEKIFIGKSLINDMTKFSCGYGKSFDGNSILVKLKNNLYVHIGNIIGIFILKNDEIIKYVSPVGNNDVPYPYAVGKNSTINLRLTAN